MAASRDEQNKNEKLGAGEILNEFFQKHRKVIVIGFLSLVVVLAALVIGISIRDNLQEKALARVDEFSRRYDGLKKDSGSEAVDAVLKQSEVAVLLVEIEGLAKKTSGFAGARASGLQASILAAEKDWDNAEIAYLAAAKKAGKSYLAPINYFNAAVAAEEAGKIDEAISHLNSAVNHKSDFPAAARAQFSIGRLEETRNDKIAALAAYGALVAKWPDDPVWASLAQSRMIVLSN